MHPRTAVAFVAFGCLALLLLVSPTLGQRDRAPDVPTHGRQWRSSGQVAADEPQSAQEAEQHFHRSIQAQADRATEIAYQQFIQQQRAAVAAGGAAEARDWLEADWSSPQAQPQTQYGRSARSLSESFQVQDTPGEKGEPAFPRDRHTDSYLDRHAEEVDREGHYELLKDKMPLGAAPVTPPDWRTKCAQRCEERNMDVTGVGVQAIATTKAEVRATVEYRKMLSNATIYAPQTGMPEDKQLAELISSVQQEVSRKAAAVVEFLQKDPAVAEHVTKLRTSSQYTIATIQRESNK
jgi:hypothetical protein